MFEGAGGASGYVAPTKAYSEISPELEGFGRLDRSSEDSDDGDDDSARDGV